MRPHQAPGWAGARGSVPQDDHRPNWDKPSAWGVLAAGPQPKHPWPGNREIEGRDLFKEHLVLFREGFSSFFSSSELSATDVFSSSSFSSLFISLVPEETLLRPSPPAKPAERAEPHAELEGPDPHRRLGVPQALFLQWHAKLILHCCSTLREDGGGCAGSALLTLPILPLTSQTLQYGNPTYTAERCELCTHT